MTVYCKPNDKFVSSAEAWSDHHWSDQKKTYKNRQKKTYKNRQKKTYKNR